MHIFKSALSWLLSRFELQPGDYVKLKSRPAHANSDWVPVINTKGVIVRHFQGDKYLVQWETHSTSMDDAWVIDPEYVRKTNGWHCSAKLHECREHALNRRLGDEV